MNPAIRRNPVGLPERLISMGLLKPFDAYQLNPMLPNLQRKDRDGQHLYQLIISGNPVAHIVTGPGLATLHQRTKDFSEACPGLGCQILGWDEGSGLDCCLAIEAVNGPTLEAAFHSGGLVADEIYEKLKQVAQALQSTQKPSNRAAFIQELDSLVLAGIESPVFTLTERTLVMEVVLPAIRKASDYLSIFTTRWSNGDLIARNILISSDGTPKVIDCEFAVCTHFYGEDGWRLPLFSNLPSEVFGSCGALLASLNDAPWMEIIYILRQISLVSGQRAGVSPAILAADIGIGTFKRLASLLTGMGFISGETLIPALARTNIAQPKACMVQIFWSESTVFSEANSRRYLIRTNECTEIRLELPIVSSILHLRLDPMDQSGWVELDHLSVFNSQNGQAYFDLNYQQLVGGSRVEVFDRGRNILCFDHDPILFLPPLVGAVGQILLTVRLKCLGAAPWPLVSENCIRRDRAESIMERLGNEEARKNELISHEDHVNAVARLNAEASKRDTMLATLNQSLNERDSNIDALKVAVVERTDTIAKLNAEVSNRETTLMALNQTLHERDVNIGLLRKAVAEYELKLDCLIVDALKLKDEVHRMQTAISWKITAPLRLLRHVFNR